MLTIQGSCQIMVQMMLRYHAVLYTTFNTQSRNRYISNFQFPLKKNHCMCYHPCTHHDDIALVVYTYIVLYGSLRYKQPAWCGLASSLFPSNKEYANIIPLRNDNDVSFYGTFS